MTEKKADGSVSVGSNFLHSTAKGRFDPFAAVNRIAKINKSKRMNIEIMNSKTRLPRRDGSRGRGVSDTTLRKYRGNAAKGMFKIAAKPREWLYDPTAAPGINTNRDDTIEPIQNK